MIRTVIVDDEPLAREVLRLRLAGVPDFAVVAEAADGETAVREITEHHPELVLLDVRLPDCTGFDVLDRLAPGQRPFVVFVTAYDEYALRAFDAHAVAYLLKPFDDLRFGAMIAHVRRLLPRSSGAVQGRLDELLMSFRPAGPPAPPSLAVRTGGTTRFVALDDIDWIEAAGDYVRVHCGDTAHLAARSISDLASTLDGRFVRVHRSAIVNIRRVAEVRTEDRRDFTLLLHDGSVVRLSRSYRRAFEEAVGHRL